MSSARLRRLPPYDGSEAILRIVFASSPERDSTPDILSAPSMRSAALRRSDWASLSIPARVSASTRALRVTSYLAGRVSFPLAVYPQRLHPRLISTTPPSRVRLRTDTSTAPQTGHSSPTGLPLSA
ncbi:MAG: hypothetical protein Q4Q58_01320 [Thermoplasmata archaeon]|nr:hypothetical protein [Thermoplasmata archaeon]